MLIKTSVSAEGPMLFFKGQFLKKIYDKNWKA